MQNRHVHLLLVLLVVASSAGCKNPAKEGQRPGSSGIVESIKSLVKPSSGKEQVYDAGDGRIRKIGLSPDATRWFVTVSTQVGTDRGFIVTEKGKQSENVHALTPMYAADADVLFYTEITGGSESLVIDRPGTAAQRHEADVVEIIPSADGSHAYYTALEKEERQALYHDGTRLTEINFLEQQVVPPTGPHHGLVMHRENRELAVLDGTLGPEYDAVARLSYGGDGVCHAYVASTDEEQFVVLDGKELEHFPAIDDFIALAPDCSRVAYATLRWDPDGGYTARVVIGDEKGPEYEHVSDLSFSQDGARFAYVAKQDGRSFVVKDGRKDGKDYFRARSTTFSSDGSHLAHIGFEGKEVGEGRATHLEGKWFIVRDGVAGEPLDDLEPRRSDSLEVNGRFSHDGTHLAWVADRALGFRSGDRNVTVILDGAPGPFYVNVSDLFFTPGSDVLVYRVLVFEKEVTGLASSTISYRYAYVIGGREGPFFDDVSAPVVDEEGKRLRYLAQEGSRVYLMTVEL